MSGSGIQLPGTGGSAGRCGWAGTPGHDGLTTSRAAPPTPHRETRLRQLGKRNHLGIDCIGPSRLSGHTPRPDHQLRRDADHAAAGDEKGPPIAPRVASSCQREGHLIHLRRPTHRRQIGSLLVRKFLTSMRRCARSTVTGWVTCEVGADNDLCRAISPGVRGPTSPQPCGAPGKAAHRGQATGLRVSKGPRGDMHPGSASRGSLPSPTAPRSRPTCSQ